MKLIIHDKRKVFTDQESVEIVLRFLDSLRASAYDDIAGPLIAMTHNDKRVLVWAHHNKDSTRIVIQEDKM